ncbi:hypothetical protein [Paenibacillus dokdonensis]|uniref:hypothetical protein n=1 Tax=Paenibacillus dokdonensis TaxID=2567944 RepID=UPI0010A89CDB|nr:hypothetical protein [Paenibacillus dokdonensis]
MKTKMKAGIIGCGNISAIYLGNFLKKRYRGSGGLYRHGAGTCCGAGSRVCAANAFSVNELLADPEGRHVVLESKYEYDIQLLTSELV